jgi:hypothetical protein
MVQNDTFSLQNRGELGKNASDGGAHSLGVWYMFFGCFVTCFFAFFELSGFGVIEKMLRKCKIL